MLEQVGDLDSTGRIRRIDGRHFSKQTQRFLLLARLPKGFSRRFKAADRLCGQTHPLIELCQGFVVGESVGLQILDLFEDRDGSGVETLLHELVGDIRIGFDGFRHLPPTPVGIAQLQTQLGVARIKLNKLAEFFERLFLGALLGVLARRL